MRGIARGQLIDEQLHRGAIGNDVVHGEEQHVLIVAEAQELSVKQWPGGEIERAVRGYIRQLFNCCRSCDVRE